MKELRILATVVAGAGLLLGTSFAPTSAQADVAYTFTTSLNSTTLVPPDFTSYSLGFTFTANADVTVTSLGYFDYLGDGFLTSHDLGIYSGDGAEGPGSLLASTTLAAGMSGTLGPNDFRYAALDAPLNLIAGQQYTIAGTDLGGIDPYLWGGPTETTGFSVIDAITIGPDAARFIVSSTPGTLEDPSQHFSDFQFYGVNFNVVPLPGALPLFASGLIGLGWLARRKNRKSRASNSGSSSQ